MDIGRKRNEIPDKPCQTCKGNGYEDTQCNNCGCDIADHVDNIWQFAPGDLCPVCSRGVHLVPCRSCDGTGKMSEADYQDYVSNKKYGHEEKY